MKKVRVVNKKNLSTMIVGVVTIAIVVVCVFLYVSRPTEIDKLSQSYLDTVDVEKLQKKVETSFDGSYRLSDYLVYGETLSLYKDEYGTKKMDKMQGNNIVLRMNCIHMIIMKRSVSILTMHLRRRQSQQCVAIKR